MSVEPDCVKEYVVRKSSELVAAVLVFGSAIGIIAASRADPVVLVLILTLYFGGYSVGRLDEPE